MNGGSVNTIMTTRRTAIGGFSFLQRLFILSVLCLCMGGMTVLAGFRTYLGVLIAVVCLSMLLAGREFVPQKPLAIAGLGFLTWCVCGLAYSCDRSATLVLVVTFACAYIMMLLRQDVAVHQAVIGGIKWIAIVFAVSILLSVVVDQLIPRYFLDFIVNNDQAYDRILRELSIGSYSGLAGEKAEAAWIMNLGIAAVISQCFAEKRFRRGNVLLLILFYLALILTAKRMLFAVSLIVPAAMLAFGNMKGRKTIMIGIGLLLAGALLLVSLAVPQLNVLFERVMASGEDVTLNGRAKLWMLAQNMWQARFWTGYGLGSYTGYIQTQGVNWTHEGHNIYLQLLGETGIIGLLLFLAFAATGLITAMRFLRSAKDAPGYRLVMFSFYVQLAFLIYGFTGNGIYSANQFFIYVLSISMIHTLDRRHKKKDTVGIYTETGGVL